MTVQVLIVNGHPDDDVIQVLKTAKDALSLEGVTGIILEVVELDQVINSAEHPDAIQWSVLPEGETPTGDNLGVGQIKLRLADLLPVGVYTARIFLIDPAHPQGRPLITEESITPLRLRVME